MGTAFAVSIGSLKNNSVHSLALATAWHVLEPATPNEIPLSLVSADGSSRIDSANSRIHFLRLGDARHDTGLIVITSPTPLLSQADLLPMLPFGYYLPRGIELGWIGFPYLFDHKLCLFKGVVSGHLNEPPTYLVDGVAINGVSGGPAFDDRCHLIGLVSAYIPNRLDKNTTLPGLLSVIPIAAIRYWMEYQERATVL